MNKRTNLITRFLIWRRQHISDNRFVNILSIIVGALAGLSAVVIKSSVHFIQDLLTKGFLPQYYNLNFVFYPLIGIFLVLVFKKFILKKPIGHGIPNVLYAIGKNNGIIKGYQMWSSVVTSAFTVGFGGSVGLEGPTVSTGAAIGSNLGRFLHLDFKRIQLLIGCASAAAMAAIFKAPIAAIIFAVEVLMLDLTMTAFIPLLVSSVTATIVSYAFLGQMFLYDFDSKATFSLNEVPYYILFGIFTGFISLHFTKVYSLADRWFDKIKGWFLKYIIGALILGLLIFLFPSFYGEGYSAIDACLKGNYDYLFNHTIFFEFHDSQIMSIALFLAIILLKVFATQATFGSGGIGGIFAPSMFIGANTGLFFANILNMGWNSPVSPQKFALVGMSGLIAGVIHAPLTAIFLIAEITGGYHLFMPLMIVSTISYGTIRFFTKTSVYTSQLAKKGELFTHHKDKVVLSLLKVPDLLETNFKTVNKTASLGDLVKIISSSKRNVFPVIDDDNTFCGTVHLNDIRNVIFKPELYETTSVVSLMNTPLAIASLDESMEDIVEKFQSTQHYNIPVIDGDKYLGFVSRAAVLTKYRKLLKHFSED